MRASRGLITNKHSGMYHKVLLFCLSHCWELAEENGAAYLLQEVFLVSYHCSLSLSLSLFYFLPAVVTVAFWIFCSFWLSAWLFSDQESLRVFFHPKRSGNNQLVTGSVWLPKVIFRDVFSRPPTLPLSFLALLSILLIFNCILLHIQMVKQVLF